MPNYWSDKDERQYAHIRESLGDNARAKEIAARTVNKHRAMEGRTKKGKKQGTRHKEMVEKHIHEMMTLDRH